MGIQITEPITCHAFKAARRHAAIKRREAEISEVKSKLASAERLLAQTQHELRSWHSWWWYEYEYATQPVQHLAEPSRDGGPGDWVGEFQSPVCSSSLPAGVSKVVRFAGIQDSDDYGLEADAAGGQPALPPTSPASLPDSLPEDEAFPDCDGSDEDADSTEGYSNSAYEDVITAEEKSARSSTSPARRASTLVPRAQNTNCFAGYRYSQVSLEQQGVIDRGRELAALVRDTPKGDVSNLPTASDRTLVRWGRVLGSLAKLAAPGVDEVIVREFIAVELAQEEVYVRMGKMDELDTEENQEKYLLWLWGEIAKRLRSHGHHVGGP